MSELALARVEQTGAHSYHVSHGTDAHLFVEFSSEAVYQEFLSEKEGRPIYADVPHIKIIAPGNKLSEVFRPVRMTSAESGSAPPDPERFPKQWQAFLNKQEQVSDGMPVDHWPPLKKSQVMELKAQRIYTVEQIAGITDANVGVLGLDGRKLRDLANAWVTNAKGGAAVSELAAENAALKTDIEILKAQFAEMSKERADARKGALK